MFLYLLVCYFFTRHNHSPLHLTNRRKQGSFERIFITCFITYSPQAQKSAVEALRQNLARDFPEHRRSPGLPPLRPGSPAEREKHKVKQSSLEHLVDLDTILRASQGDDESSQRKLGKPGEFRKSLSSSCVSTSAKTKSVECQTSDELVQYLLPTLRRRCVAKGKKLERSCAVVDEGLHQVRAIDTTTESSKQSPSSSGALKAVHVFNYPSVYHQKHALTIQKQPVMFLTLADDAKSLKESSRSSNTRPQKNSDHGFSGRNLLGDNSPHSSFIPGIRQHCCQQSCHYSYQHRNQRRGRKYHSMVVPPSHVSDHVCKVHSKSYRFPRLYGFDELTPSCSSDTSCVDDIETVESAAVVSERRPKSASPGHCNPRYSQGHGREAEQEPFLSPAHLPRDSRSRSAGYIPLHACCTSSHEEPCSGVCWVESLATTSSANDCSNASTATTTDSSSLILPQFQSSGDSDDSQISNEEDDLNDGDRDSNIDNTEGLPEGLELYVTDPRTDGGVSGAHFSQSPFMGGINKTKCQASPREDKRDQPSNSENAVLSCNLVLNSQRLKEDGNSSSSLDNSTCLMQLNSPQSSRPIDKGQVAAGYRCDSPDNSDMKEFQRLLQGHGVQIDISRIQSSDL